LEINKKGLATELPITNPQLAKADLDTHLAILIRSIECDEFV